MKYKYKYMTSAVVIVMVLYMSTMSIITQDKKISELEGRSLQVLPTTYNIYGNNEIISNLKYIWHSFTGQLFEWWDDYFSDHIYLRDNIVNTYSSIQNKLDKNYVNGVFLGADDYLISESNVKGVSTTDLKDSAEHFNKIANKFSQAQTYIVNLPKKHMLYEDKMPINDYSAPENYYIDEFINHVDKNKIDILDFREVASSEEDLYYKTDHHWNMNGAYLAYENIIEMINKKFIEVNNPKAKDTFNIQKYQQSFIGTDGRKVTSIDYSDDIEIYIDDEFKDYKVYNKDGETKLIHDELLMDDSLNNDYSVYLGGDNSELVVKNNQSDNELKIVILGDSMDNALIPLLAPHFKELYSFDQREYTGFEGDINKIVEDINPDIIMFIGLSNFFIDGSESEIFKWDIDN